MTAGSVAAGGKFGSVLMKLRAAARLRHSRAPIDLRILVHWRVMKAPEGGRSPRRSALSEASEPRASVLEQRHREDVAPTELGILGADELQRCRA